MVGGASEVLGVMAGHSLVSVWAGPKLMGRSQGVGRESSFTRRCFAKQILGI